jgi:glycosyltransferase A (GT-A) superfamily protein (DUF2064 family)
MPLNSMRGRALLIFADDAKFDLARRGLPIAALPLLQFPSPRQELTVTTDIHIFSSASRPSCDAVRVHRQRGADFAQRFENAIETLSALGYGEIVAIGRDCPTLRTDDIVQAFEHLREKQLVLGPDHRGGCYLIAFRLRNRALLQGIRWKKNTDCAQLRARCDEEGVFLLPVKHDLDSWADLRILARGSDWIAKVASSLLQFVFVADGSARHFVDLARHFTRVRGQMPPPVSVA